MVSLSSKGAMTTIKVDTHWGFSLLVNDNTFMSEMLIKFQSYETPETMLLRELVKPGDFCVDVGAHVGYHACVMLERGAAVVAIEPNPAHHELLRQNMRDVCLSQDILNINNWNLVKAAASNVDAELVDFFLPSTWNDGWGSLGFSDLEGSQTLVRSVRLETVLNDFHINNVKLIKIDVEGAELLVLQGLGAWLEKTDYLLLECEDRKNRVDKLGSSAASICQFLSGWMIKGFVDGAWQVVTAPNKGNYLFINPRLK